METDEFFTIKEKDLLFSLYRKLLQLSGETLQKGDCKKPENTSCQYYTEQPYPA